MKKNDEFISVIINIKILSSHNVKMIYLIYKKFLINY